MSDERKVRTKQRTVKLVFVDRYSATGKPYPDPKTVCKGKCEGMGCYPDMQTGLGADAPFVRCERCNGTGLEPT